MRLFSAGLIVAFFVLGGTASLSAQTPPSTEMVLSPGTSYHITCATSFQESFYQVSPGVWDVTCAPSLATTTPTSTPVVPPTATPALPPPGFHAPGSHGSLNFHEHGDAPPAWVVNSVHPPFSQTREGHVGYKGVYARDSGGRGVESYFIGHVISTAGARSHGDHDYQLWIKDPSGGVSYWDGVLDFGSPPPLRLADTGERPIILSVNDGGCETWYNRPGSTVLDLGWTICGRVDTFDGRHLGVGTFRTVDWLVIPSRFTRFPGAASTLAQYCTVEFGVCRISFIVNSRSYAAPGIAVPN